MALRLPASSRQHFIESLMRVLYLWKVAGGLVCWVGEVWAGLGLPLDRWSQLKQLQPLLMVPTAF
jgi:hypothetical protein